MENLITRSIDLAGLKRLAHVCGVSYQAIRKWELARRLPRTEWTGETDYSTLFELATGGEVTRDQLLAWSIESYRKPCYDEAAHDERQPIDHELEETA